MSQLLILLIIVVGLLIICKAFSNKVPAVYTPTSEDIAAMNEWHDKYFKDIVFPVIIFKREDYLVVSDLTEYYLDVDINIFYIKPDCELVDSLGQIYNFQQINNMVGVPDKMMGTMAFEELKQRLKPLLFLPDHKKNIDATSSIKDIMQLVSTE